METLPKGFSRVRGKNDSEVDVKNGLEQCFK
jgi:hypothetical protein